MSEEYKRFTISLPKDLYDEFEVFRNKLNVSRSDAIRKAMHTYMTSEENIPILSGDVVGCITMIMSHEHFEEAHTHNNHEDLHEKDDSTHEHEYSSKPIYANVHQTDLILSNDIQHHYTDVIISTMHAHLQFEKCLEILAVSGPYDRVKKLKESLQRLKSVLSIGFFIIDKEIK
ncbi:MAG: ribbon-helix-helix protein, CopG family [Candidatus Lokiarchaeota archaeon]|nr:ribbon-helix-helix protein, CopG family [Candidatus Lokiarchaeota archaeon]MBD3198548.1 ribbon-helix-helix protein, CopG family [Candidatus Lokiarchaeota archaeon]